MTSTRPIRVLCVDDHEFIAQGLASAMSLERDLELVGHLSSADDCCEAVAERRADVVLLDVEMPGEDPFEMLDTLRRRHPAAKVIVLSAFVRDGYIDRAMDLGAAGYYSKADPPEHLMEGIRKAMAGECTFGPAVLERMQLADDRAHRRTDTRSKLDTLTPREMQVLCMMGKGMARADVAQALHRSRKTIDVHSTNIMKKLDIHDRVELARFAIREGLVEA